VLHLNAVATNRVDFVCSLVDRPVIPAGLHLVRKSLALPKGLQTHASRLSSASGPFSVYQPDPLFFPEATSHPDYPAATFAPSLRVFGATFCRGRLDVICAGDCGSELDHAPPASFSAAFRYRFRRVRPDQCFPGLSLERFPADTGNAPGISRTLRSLNPVTQVEDQSSRVLAARLPFHKSPPRQILVGGSTARSARPCFSIGQSITGTYCGFRAR
jgi:hypothetical protein